MSAGDSRGGQGALGKQLHTFLVDALQPHHMVRARSGLGDCWGPAACVGQPVVSRGSSQEPAPPAGAGGQGLHTGLRPPTTTCCAGPCWVWGQHAAVMADVTSSSYLQRSCASRRRTRRNKLVSQGTSGLGEGQPQLCPTGPMLPPCPAPTPQASRSQRSACRVLQELQLMDDDVEASKRVLVSLRRCPPHARLLCPSPRGGPGPHI